jgi:site-specific recombinase XerD
MSERTGKPIPSILSEAEWQSILASETDADPLSEADKRMIEALQTGVNWCRSGMMVSTASKIDPDETFRL